MLLFLLFLVQFFFIEGVLVQWGERRLCMSEAQVRILDTPQNGSFKIF